jgi:hypothetical protein
MIQKGSSFLQTKPNGILFGCVAACFFCSSAKAQLTIFADRGSLQQALGTTSAFDNFGAYSIGQIGQGNRLGDFVYGFFPNTTLPMIAPDGSGNHVLGGAPYRVFVGGDQVTLTNANSGGPLTAFGVDFSYAPTASTIPANTFSITILDGPAAGRSVGNPPLSSAGGTCFLGFIANPGIEFTSVNLSATQTDPNTIVPAYQVNDMVYHNGIIPALFYSSVHQAGQNIFLQGGGGLPGGRFFYLSTTNLTLPLGQWLAVTTNYFDSSGNFSLTRSMNKPTEFFLLKPD